MRLPRAAVRYMLVAPALAGALAACNNSTESSPIAGTYTATTFRATPTGQGVIDILAHGGSVSLTIASDNTTNGTLLVPASVTGGAPLSANMAGTAVRTGSMVKFQQSADTFMRDLTWTVSANGLAVTDQAIGGATWVITLTRS